MKTIPESNNRITTKELFERVIQLETKIDLFSCRTLKTEKRLEGYVIGMFAITLINALISLVFLYKYVL